MWLCPSPGCAEQAERRGVERRGVDQRSLPQGEGTVPGGLRALLGAALAADVSWAVRAAVRAGALAQADADRLLEPLGAAGDGVASEADLPPSGLGMTHSIWSARILRRFQRLGAFRAAEREFAATTAGRRRVRLDRRQDVSGC